MKHVQGIFWVHSVVFVVWNLAIFLLAVKHNWVIETRRRQLELQICYAKQDEITEEFDATSI